MVDEQLIEEIVRRVLARLLGPAAAQQQGPPEPAPAAPSAQPSAARSPEGVRHSARVLTEWDVLTAHRSGKGYIEIGRKTIVTPLAKDRARDLGVDLVVRD